MNYLIYILIILRALATFIPAFQYFAPAGFNVVVCFLLLLLLLKNASVRNGLYQLLPILIFEFIRVIFYTEFSVTSVYAILRLLVWPSIICWIVVYKEQMFAKRLLFIIIGCLVVTSATTYYGNYVFPWASRILATGDERATQMMHTYMKYNIGSFNFVYTICLTMPLVIYQTRNIPKMKEISLLILLLFWAMIIKTEYTTALIVCLMTLPLFFFNGNINKLIWLLIIAVIVAFVFDSLLPNFFSNLSKWFSSESISERLMDISRITNGEDILDTNDAMARNDRWQRSLQEFLHNPLTGTFGDISKNGGHSFILDNMSNWGILGVITMYVVFRTIYKRIIEPFKGNVIYGYAIYSYIILIFLASVNPEIIYTFVMCVCPLFCLVYNSEN